MNNATSCISIESNAIIKFCKHCKRAKACSKVDSLISLMSVRKETLSYIVEYINTFFFLKLVFPYINYKYAV